MQNLEIISKKIKRLCHIYKLPIPIIQASKSTDACDFTSSTEIRLNVAKAGEINPDNYAAHVFAHYICDLHCGQSDKYADHVADVIVDLLHNQ